MHDSWGVSFPEGFTVSAGADGELTIEGPYGPLILRRVPEPVRAALARLAPPGESLGRLATVIHDAGTPDLLARLFLHLQRLATLSSLCITAKADHHRLATLVPMGPSFVLNRGGVTARPYVLSRFACLRREGRRDAAAGNSYRFLGKLPSPPAVKPPACGPAIELFCPDLESIEREDPPLARVMEKRSSIREYGVRPLTTRQLGEFLFRVARVRARWEGEFETPSGVVRLDLTSRPYPTGGALFALEIYVAVLSCDGLAPGLYHYEPVGHLLESLSDLSAETSALLEQAGSAAMIPREKVQTLLICGARFGRVAWKYSSLAFALILKDTGVLMQTMYLAAEAMGLAPCAVGTGDSDLFARAIGSDYYEESSVGEFLLGSRA